MRYKITLSYYGKNYHGWQKQPNAVTVQEVLDNALTMLLRQNIETVGAGRTDSGVHAEFFAAHFDSAEKITDLKKLSSKLNAFLPYDIAVFNIEEVSEDFNARFSAKSRTYKYLIHTEKNPFLKENSWFYPKNLNLKIMEKGCEILFKTSDFASFCKMGGDNKTTICKIFKAEFLQKGSQIIFTIKADRFLRNMVRAIVGTLVELGSGKISLNDFQEIINSKNRCGAGQSVPAHGLYLIDVEY